MAQFSSQYFHQISHTGAAAEACGYRAPASLEPGGCGGLLCAFGSCVSLRSSQLLGWVSWTSKGGVKGNVICCQLRNVQSVCSSKARSVWGEHPDRALLASERPDLHRSFSKTVKVTTKINKYKERKKRKHGMQTQQHLLVSLVLAPPGHK